MPLVFLSPPISISTAHALAVFFACSYVGSLYISKNARLVFKNVSTKGLQNGQQRAKEDDERWRDDPDVIRARVIAACLSTTVNCTVVLCVVWRRLKWQWNVRRFAHCAEGTSVVDDMPSQQGPANCP